MLYLNQIQLFLSSHPFAELAVVFGVVGLISYLMKVLKQPMIVGYIIAGILLGPAMLGWLQHTEQAQIFSHIGVVLLLFMVGLGLNPSLVKELGTSSVIIGVGQVVFTSVIGVGIALLLGFTSIESIYIALALSFSSTIIIVKLLSDKGVMDELFGKVSLGMLIVQDIIAMLIVMTLSSLPAPGVEVVWLSFVLVLLVKILLVAGVSYALSRYVLPKLLPLIANSQEFLLIFTIGRSLLFAASMELIGFSLEIGALLAGVTLASSPYRFEIASKLKSLRDFFIMIFFVFLGSQLQFAGIFDYLFPIIVFSLFVLIGNPLVIMSLMGYLGYQKKNSMMVGFTTAQISEFSFILMGIALAVGHITNTYIVSMITIIGLITIAGSSYYFAYSEQIYYSIKKYLSFFERRVPDAEKEFSDQNEQYDIVVFGNHRTAHGIVDMLVKNNKNFIIVDYDPHVIKKLQSQGIPCKYGDAGDIDLLEELNLHKAKMIVSTIHDYESNALILHQTKKIHTDLVTIMSANRIDDAESLYEQGANYVLVPHIIGGHHTAMLIEQYEYDVEKYAQHKLREYKLLA